MRNKDGSPITTHSTAFVPHLIIKDGIKRLNQPGKSGDVIRTALRLIGLQIPQAVTERTLVDI